MALWADYALLVFTLLIFGSVVLLTYAFAGRVGQRQRISQRFGAVPVGAVADEGERELSFRRLGRFDAGRFGLNAKAQRTLRFELIRAGYLSPDGVGIFAAARILLVGAVPLLGYVLLTLADWANGPKLTVLALLCLVAFYLPSAFLKRRQRLVQNKYRATFPEFLDMLVVCINAGLSLDAALDRATQELGPADTELRANLELMAGEMRAGKSTADGLRDCAERLALPEARSFATLLRQSIELGTDLTLALTTFADEMRDKRMSRAEEKAAALPPKLTLPLAGFIFPVVLIVVLAPAVLKVLKAVGP